MQNSIFKILDSKVRQRTRWQQVTYQMEKAYLTSREKEEQKKKKRNSRGTARSAGGLMRNVTDVNLRQGE